MKRLIVFITAALMLASCGSADSSETAQEQSSIQQTETLSSSGSEAEDYPEGWYRITADTALYDSSGNAVPSGDECFCKGVGEDGRLKVSLPAANGKNELGEMQYVYRDYYIEAADVHPASANEAKNAVVSYAVAMSEKTYETYELSGEYVGEDETRSDCSGMTELAYLCAGIYLEHYADAQANNYGTVIYDNLVPAGEDSGNAVYTLKDAAASVDYSHLEPGDLLFFLCATNSAGDNDLYTADGIGHVAMYIGDGRMVHFTADYGLTNDPCRIEDLAAYEANVLRVERAVRYIFEI